MATMNDLKKATAAPAKKSSSMSVMDIFTSPKFKAQMALALPKHMTSDRMSRIVMTECRKTPALMKCNVPSLLGAVMQAAQLGLEPGSALGHCYLLPFGNGKANDGLSNCQLIIGYRGMIDLARRSGQLVSIGAYLVHEGDDFHYQLGLHPDIQHVPDPDCEDRPVTHVYAVANLKDGGVQFEVLSRKAIEKTRSYSKAATKGPWVDHWDEMAKKAVVRRLFKYLPISIETARAIQVDENTDRGIDMKLINGEIVDTEEETLPAADQDTGEITMTFAQVADQILKSENQDILDIAIDNIALVPEAQRDELYKLAQKQQEKFN